MAATPDAAATDGAKPKDRFAKWDEVAREVTKEEATEKPPGDEVNALFRVLYKDGACVLGPLSLPADTGRASCMHAHAQPTTTRGGP